MLKAIKNIYACLKEGGTFLMAECSKKSLKNLNLVRDQFNLAQIEERWHNFYLEEENILKDIDSYFRLEKIDSFNSTYYLVSRTLNAIIKDKDCEPDYKSKINQLAAQLPAEGDYAPLKLFILKRK